MIFRELNNSKCKTYLLASEGMERAVIIDPVKDRVERYLGVLAYHRLKLDLIVDTHTHADHRSGAHELSPAHRHAGRDASAGSGAARHDAFGGRPAADRRRL